jgi:AcrR family transcriptional regulator
MDGFERRRNDKKEAIVQAATELFDQYGFDRVTVSEIAEKARVSKVSIYNFFESKDNLRRVIIKGFLDAKLAERNALLESDKSFKDKIGDFVNIQSSYYGKHSLKLFFEAVDGDPSIKRYFDEYTAANYEYIRRFIDMGKQSGVFAKNLSHEVIETYIDIFASYYFNHPEIGDKFERNPELAREANMLFLGGLIQQESANKGEE